MADWIYVSSDKIHQLVFGLSPGQSFRHSEEFRTIFAADEVLYVLSGTMILANPETGEVHRVQPGEAAFFRRDTWHHAFNYSAEPLRVLEYFAPPPSQGTSGAYARTKPNLTEVKYTQDHLLEQWADGPSSGNSRLYNPGFARIRSLVAVRGGQTTYFGWAFGDNRTFYRRQNLPATRPKKAMCKCMAEMKAYICWKAR